MRWMVALFAVCVALCLSLPAMAQTVGQLRATVVDEDGFPIPKATLRLLVDNAGTLVQEMASDANGEFLFVGLAPGSYRLVVTKEGFGGVTFENIQVKPEQTFSLEVTLPQRSVIHDEWFLRPSIDTESTTTGRVLDQRFLRKIPSGR